MERNKEAWLRLSRADTAGVENLGGWLTTVVSRVCLDMLRSRTSRREEPLGVERPEDAAGADPEEEALVADSVGSALLIVLDTLTPAERLAFVLHDVFALPFDEIAPILGRTPSATKMLASRARRRVQTADASPDADPARQREVVSAFLAASRGGDFDALLALLHPDVVLRPDPAVVEMGGSALRGARVVVEEFSRRARGAELVLVDGAAGAVWAPDGTPRVVFLFTITRGRIAAIDLVGDPDRLRRLDVTFLDR